jgi:hypothetical protein
LHAVCVVEFSDKKFLIKYLSQPTPLPMMTAFMSMPVTMGMVSVVIIVAILVPKVFFFSAICMGIYLQLLLGFGDEPFKLSTIEPNTSTQLADIYGDTIPVLFFKSRFVTSWTNHLSSFYVKFSGHRSMMPGVREVTRKIWSLSLSKSVSNVVRFHNNVIRY